jgi:hypothetical protein
MPDAIQIQLCRFFSVIGKIHTVKPFLLLVACSLFSIIFSGQIIAQENRDTAAQTTFSIVPITDSLKTREIKSYFQVGASYVSDNVYLGRKDSVALPYFTPSLGYYAKSGFFTNASFGFLTSASASRLDVVNLAMGYAFTKGNYDGELTGAKYFYSSQSTSVKSEVKASVEYLSGYDFGFIRPTLLATFNIGNKLDIAGSPGLEHTFSLLKDKGEITPTVLMNASTQNYYNDYYKVRRYNPKRKTKIPPNGVASISGEVLNAAAFKVLDYEFSVPLKYSFGKCEISFTPVYAVPVHPAEVAIITKLNNGTTNTKTGVEKLQNTFFSTLEFICKF